MESTLKDLRGVADQPLEWTQRNTLRREYELRARNDVVALLCWDKVLGSLAVAESADGRWTFKRSGFLSPRVTVRMGGSDSEVATLSPRWRGEGTLECTNGSRYRWVNASFWRSEWAFASEAGEPLLHFTPKFAFLKLAAEVKAESGAVSILDLSLLTLLGWYLMVLMSEDAGGAVVSG